jgi:hypothetical protein
MNSTRSEDVKAVEDLEKAKRDNQKDKPLK